MKSFIIALLIFLNFTSYSQHMDQGWIVGGAFGLDRSANATLHPGPFERESSQSSFRLRPYLGKSISDQWMIGLASNYQLQVQNYDLAEDNLTQETINQTMSLGIFSRYSLYAAESRKFNIHLEPTLSVNFGWTSERVRDVEVADIKNTSGKLDIAPIVTYSLGRSTNLIARFSALSYQVGNWKVSSSAEKKSFSIFKGTFDVTTTQIGIEFRL